MITTYLHMITAYLHMTISYLDMMKTPLHLTADVTRHNALLNNVCCISVSSTCCKICRTSVQDIFEGAKSQVCQKIVPRIQFLFRRFLDFLVQSCKNTDYHGNLLQDRADWITAEPRGQSSPNLVWMQRRCDSVWICVLHSLKRLPAELARLWQDSIGWVGFFTFLVHI